MPNCIPILTLLIFMFYYSPNQCWIRPKILQNLSSLFFWSFNFIVFFRRSTICACSKLFSPINHFYLFQPVSAGHPKPSSMRQLVNPRTFGRPSLGLALFGCTNRPFYHIVVLPDKRLGRVYEGNILEQVSFIFEMTYRFCDHAVALWMVVEKLDFVVLMFVSLIFECGNESSSKGLCKTWMLWLDGSYLRVL